MVYGSPRVDIAELVGKTFTSVTGEGDVMRLSNDEETYVFSHDQDCCESVGIEEVHGDLDDLVGTPILLAEEETNADGPEPKYAESYTWTFYKFATVKGHVTVRWLGESNGYYSETVDLRKVK